MRGETSCARISLGGRRKWQVLAEDSLGLLQTPILCPKSLFSLGFLHQEAHTCKTSRKEEEGHSCLCGPELLWSPSGARRQWRQRKSWQEGQPNSTWKSLNRGVKQGFPQGAEPRLHRWGWAHCLLPYVLLGLSELEGMLSHHYSLFKRMRNLIVYMDLICSTWVNCSKLLWTEIYMLKYDPKVMALGGGAFGRRSGVCSHECNPYPYIQDSEISLPLPPCENTAIGQPSKNQKSLIRIRGHLDLGLASLQKCEREVSAVHKLPGLRYSVREAWMD